LQFWSCRESSLPDESSRTRIIEVSQSFLRGLRG